MRGTSTAILGGSFDPVHLGHLFLLHCAVSMTDYDSFLVIPAKVSNFKQPSRPLASDSDRLEMLGLALQDYRDIYPEDREVPITVNSMELERGGVSYTSDTVREMKSALGPGRIGWIMGDDHIPGLSRWHDFDYLRENVQFLICRRNPEGALWDRVPSGVSYVKLEPSTLAGQSSSAIRDDLGATAGYLSKRVYEYVREHNLYG